MACGKIKGKGKYLMSNEKKFNPRKKFNIEDVNIMKGGKKKMKALTILAVLLLCVGLVSAIKPNTSNHIEKIVDAVGKHSTPTESKPSTYVPIISNTPAISKVKTENQEYSSLLTKWVWDGTDCVKADILSWPFTISPTSKYTLPHIVVTENSDGSKVIRRVFSGEKRLAFDKSTRRIMNTQTCYEKIIEPTQLEPNWMR